MAVEGETSTKQANREENQYGFENEKEKCSEKSELGNEKPLSGIPIYVDACNAIMDESNKAVLSRLLTLMKTLRELGCSTLVIVEAWVRHHIDDPDGLKQLIKEGHAVLTPAGEEADEFVLDLAARTNGIVVSSDGFKEYMKNYGEVINRKLKFLIAPDPIKPGKWIVSIPQGLILFISKNRREFLS